MEFENFRDKIIKEIEQKKDLSSTDKKSGIYAIYIENFDYKLMEYEKCILPIYVGQSKNIYTRMLAHKTNLNKIFEYTINEFNKNLKTKKESQYLYHKIRKCINDTNLTIESIKFKVLEYCDEDKLLERERHYIDLYKTETFGLNQLNSIQKIVATNVNKVSDEEIIDLIDLIKKDSNQVLLDFGRNYGFASFNASMLCYNCHWLFGRMESREKNVKQYSEKVIIKYNEILELYERLYQETAMIFDSGVPYFIEWDLKLKKTRQAKK